jgi:hypothetical protein
MRAMEDGECFRPRCEMQELGIPPSEMAPKHVPFCIHQKWQMTHREPVFAVSNNGGEGIRGGVREQRRPIIEAEGLG